MKALNRRTSSELAAPTRRKVTLAIAREVFASRAPTPALASTIICSPQSPRISLQHARSLTRGLISGNTISNAQAVSEQSVAPPVSSPSGTGSATCGGAGRPCGGARGLRGAPRHRRASGGVGPGQRGLAARPDRVALEDCRGAGGVAGATGRGGGALGQGAGSGTRAGGLGATGAGGWLLRGGAGAAACGGGERRPLIRAQAPPRCARIKNLEAMRQSALPERTQHEEHVGLRGCYASGRCTAEAAGFPAVPAVLPALSGHPRWQGSGSVARPSWTPDQVGGDRWSGWGGWLQEDRNSHPNEPSMTKVPPLEPLRRTPARAAPASRPVRPASGSAAGCGA